VTKVDGVDVLLVEDNELDAEMTMRTLSRFDTPPVVKWARDGEEALEFLKSNPRPRLVLLDLKMPKVGGIEVLRELRATDRADTVPVVVLTSSTQDHDIGECYRLGANGFVVKPVNLGELERVVHRIGLFWLTVNTPPE
jgi:two-component system response regulator